MLASSARCSLARGALLARRVASSRLPPHAAAPGGGSQLRGVAASNSPEATVYGGPSALNAEVSAARFTLRSLMSKYKKGQPITMVTAYDYPSAVHVDQAGVDILLVGDSVSMVVHGHDTTLPITMDEMLVHCRAVARGARRPLIVGDLPFGSYEASAEQAVQSAVRMLKEGGVDAVKMEGGHGARVTAAKAMSDAGIAVMGHVGLTPQAISVLGGFRPQGRSADEALQVIRHAQALQAAGCFALVLECMPSQVAAAVTAAVDIPTIGIGAGAASSGQVLVYHDLLGMMQHPHFAKVTPKFSKQYATVGVTIANALERYVADVSGGRFPSAKYSPYKISEEQAETLGEEMARQGLGEAAAAMRGWKDVPETD